MGSRRRYLVGPLRFALYRDAVRDAQFAVLGLFGPLFAGPSGFSALHFADWTLRILEWLSTPSEQTDFRFGNIRFNSFGRSTDWTKFEKPVAMERHPDFDRQFFTRDRPYSKPP